MLISLPTFLAKIAERIERVIVETEAVDTVQRVIRHILVVVAAASQSERISGQPAPKAKIAAQFYGRAPRGVIP